MWKPKTAGEAAYVAHWGDSVSAWRDEGEMTHAKWERVAERARTFVPPPKLPTPGEAAMLEWNRSREELTRQELQEDEEVSA